MRTFPLMTIMAASLLRGLVWRARSFTRTAMSAYAFFAGDMRQVVQVMMGIALLLAVAPPGKAEDLPAVFERVKPSVVVVKAEGRDLAIRDGTSVLCAWGARVPRTEGSVN
jgi:hypothetical protein